jgi:hypothetical protein
VTQGLFLSAFTNLIYGPLVGVIECGFEHLQDNSVHIEVKSFRLYISYQLNAQIKIK